MCYRTLEQWNARGRQVKKGEKAAGRLNDNTPLFGKSQTKKMPKQSQRASYTPPQKEQLQTGIRVLTGTNATNLALILAYLVNGEIVISFLYHNGSGRPISFPHPTPAGDKCLISYPSAFPTQISSTSHPEFFIQCVITVTPLPDCCPTHPRL